MNGAIWPMRYALTSFFIIAYAWTWLSWWCVDAVRSGQLSLPVSNETLATLGQFGPLAAAVIVMSVTSGRDGFHDFVGRLVRWRARPVWVIVSLLLLPATMLAAISMYSFFAGTISTLRFQDSWGTLPAHFVYTLLLAGPIGEEPGWRGFALPRMQDRYGPVVGSLWLGLLWAGWHLPLWWIYPPPCPYPVYVCGAVLMTLLFTWLFNHTQGSVFYSLIFHASLSTASVRLPEVPASGIWVLCLLCVVTIILICDPQLGRTLEGPASSDATEPMRRNATRRR